MIVTAHARKRLKERLGLKKRSAMAQAIRAFNEGYLAEDYPHKPTAKYWGAKQRVNEMVAYILHGDAVYIYGYDEATKEPFLKTVIDL